MTPHDPQPVDVDRLYHAIVLICFISGGVCFALAASLTGYAWLPKAICGVTLWGLAWHFRRLGRLD